MYSTNRPTLPLLVLVLGAALSLTATGCDNATTQSCVVGAEGCACTQGGGCDPGLYCITGECLRAVQDTSEDRDADTAPNPDLSDDVRNDVPQLDLDDESRPDVPEETWPDVPEETSPDVDEETWPDVPEETWPDVPEETWPDVPEETWPDVPEETSPDATPDDDAVEIGDGGPSDVPRDLTGCTCEDSRDVCQADVCVRDGYTCNALNACDSAYRCSSSYVCECQDPLQCGILCNTTADCPPGRVCDSTGHCNTPLGCLYDPMCGPGEVCEPGYPDATCQPAGPSPAGAVCDASSECTSGTCITRVCLPPCGENADCPSGLTCQLAFLDDGGYGTRLACYATASACTPGCAADEYCHWSTCQKSCTTGADCPQGDCHVDHVDYDPFFFGYCSGQVSSCQATEISLDIEGSGNRVCAVPQSCWVDADCATPYVCHRPYTWMHVGYCAVAP